MTRDADFKQLVRERMAATGENYTTAREALLAGPEQPPRAAAAAAENRAPNPTDEQPSSAQPADPQPNDPMPASQPGTIHSTAERTEPASTPDGTAFERARAEQARVVGRFLGADGRLTTIPMKRRARASVLLELLSHVEPGRTYREPEVNQLLASFHDDFAFWRRELVDYGYLEREAGIYRTAVRAPERPAAMRQEIPDWEALWLPGFLAGAHRPSEPHPGSHE